MNYNGEERRRNPCMQHEDFMKKLDNKVDVIMNRQVEIKAQVERTNGRVSSLESWKAFMLGGLAVISAIISVILVPMFLTWFGSQLK